MNAGQTTTTRGSIARMTRRLGTLVAALALAAGTIGLAAPAEAKSQPRCKVLSVETTAYDLPPIPGQVGLRGYRTTITTTTTRCRGVVSTQTVESGQYYTP